MARDVALVSDRLTVGIRPWRGARVWRNVWWFLRRKPLGALSAAIIVVLLLLAAFPGAFTNQEPNRQSIFAREQGPSADHWFGTDQLGRDVYTRIVYGARTSVIIGFGIVLLSAATATVVGTVSGYFGGWFDTIVQRVVDIGIALPGLVFIILVVTSLQQIPLLLRIIVAIGSLSWLGQSRVIRATVTSAKHNQYVEAARLVGASNARIMLRHIFPNVVPIIIVAASIQVGGAILIESSLAFLGYGVQPPTASWGRMLDEARQQLVRSPHLAVFPGLAIFLTVYSFNMFGDALRDILDPRLRGTR
jgi:ABC-type dipeptide/oligopeptide/nickel transport system permease subunit